jgi:hypothetical protein
LDETSWLAVSREVFTARMAAFAWVASLELTIPWLVAWARVFSAAVTPEYP